MNRLAPLLVIAIAAAGCTGSTGGAGKSSSSGSSGKTTGDPLYSLTLMRQGSILLQQEQFREALKRFQEADRIAPGNATVHNMMGLSHLKLLEYDKALVSFNTSLELIPSFTDARNNRGATYLALRQFRLAEIDFIAVLGDTTYPHRWEVYYNLGMTYLRLGQIGAAEENFRRAVTAPAPVFGAYLRLAEIAMDQGRGDESISLLEEARLQFPESNEATLRLGETLVKMDRGDEARPFLEQVIANVPGSTWAHEAAALLGID